MSDGNNTNNIKINKVNQVSKSENIMSINQSQKSSQKMNLTASSYNNGMSRQDMIMKKVEEFFGNRTHLYQMLPIIKQTAHISLRILDYFVTNYSKKKKIVYMHQGKIFNVYMNYKAQLKAYSKKQFDPFCRKMRKLKNGSQVNEAIKFYYDKGKFIETTVGQLNFFKWAISYGVLSYIVEHLTEIVEDMILSSKHKHKVDNVTKKSAKGAKGAKGAKNDKNTKNGTLSITEKKESTVNTSKNNSVAVSATTTVTTKQKIKVIVSFA